ncbi:ribonuclease Z [Salinimicrobium sp. GXAS 041]|uniref:ribonuclease Z n=1 Tax=Salinimicrobium sp. GXAS 041 TaxID=3400806 RepID=UPI003C770A80
MKTTKKNKYMLIEPQGQSITDFSSVLTKKHEEFKNENVVVDLLNYETAESAHILSFLELSDRHRMEKKSFVLVNAAVDIEKVPEELIVVPTLHEAEDIIEMEEIERDLED